MLDLPGDDCHPCSVVLIDHPARTSRWRTSITSVAPRGLCHTRGDVGCLVQRRSHARQGEPSRTTTERRGCGRAD